MRNVLQAFKITALVLATAANLGACASMGMGGSGSGTSASSLSKDGTAIDRTESIGEIATAVCERYKACNGFGKNKKYASQSDCEIQERDAFNGRWSESDCGSGGLNKAKYIDCRERIKQYQCSGNGFDLGAILTECGASQVCI